MNPGELYSAKREDLYYPCKNATFFPLGPPNSEAALCAEISRIAYCEQEDSFAFDRERTEKALAKAGFKVGGYFESTGHDKNGGFHSFLAVREAADRTDSIAVIAFRGTDKDDPSNLIADGDALFEPWEPGGEVHRGFAGALAELRDGLEKARGGIVGRILFTGHSLGAAMATLLASAWKRPAGMGDALYTIGSPRVGDAEFVATLDGVAGRRYVDCTDAVTLVPPEILGYQHFGPTYYIDRSRSINVDPNTEFLLKDKVAAVAEYVAEYAWRIGNVDVRELADHAPINYVLAVGSNAP